MLVKVDSIRKKVGLSTKVERICETIPNPGIIKMWGQIIEFVHNINN